MTVLRQWFQLDELFDSLTLFNVHFSVTVSTGVAYESISPFAIAIIESNRPHELSLFQTNAAEKNASQKTGFPR